MLGLTIVMLGLDLGLRFWGWVRGWGWGWGDRKSTRLNSSHSHGSRKPTSA